MLYYEYEYESDSCRVLATVSVCHIWYGQYIYIDLDTHRSSKM